MGLIERKILEYTMKRRRLYLLLEILDAACLHSSLDGNSGTQLLCIISSIASRLRSYTHAPQNRLEVTIRGVYLA